MRLQQDMDTDMNFKILVVPLVLLLVLVPFLSLDSFAQQPKKHTLTYALAQVQVRNSQGQLVYYLEAVDTQLLNPDILNAYLDTLNATAVVTSGGNSFELFQFQSGSDPVHFGSTSHADLAFSQGGQTIYSIRVITDGYWYDTGDKITESWTFVRVA